MTTANRTDRTRRSNVARDAQIAAFPAMVLPVVTVRPAQDPRDLTWRDKALCAQVDPEIFFVDKGGSTRPAKAVCRACEARTACLEDALDHDEPFGVRGGMSARQRRGFKARFRVAPAAESPGQVAA